MTPVTQVQVKVIAQWYVIGINSFCFSAIFILCTSYKLVRHAHYLKLSLDSVHHELPAVFVGVLHTSSLDLIPQAVDNVLHFIVREQVRNLPRCKEVVDDHQKLFLGHLSISE